MVSYLIIFFHKYRNPLCTGKPEIGQFLSYLAVQAGVAPATQRIALNALMFLYVKFYGRNAEELVFSSLAWIGSASLEKQRLLWLNGRPFFRLVCFNRNIS